MQAAESSSKQNQKWTPKTIELRLKDVNRAIQFEAEKFLRISGYAQDLYENMLDHIDDEEYHEQRDQHTLVIEAELQDITVEASEAILRWCQLTNYSNRLIDSPIQTGLLEENLSPEDENFIRAYPVTGSNKLNEFYQAARYLQIAPLIDVIVCRIATEFYFGYDQQSFEDLKKKLQIEDDLTVEGEEELIREYPWLRQEEN